jgi:hypothetical protein
VPNWLERKLQGKDWRKKKSEGAPETVQKMEPVRRRDKFEEIN